jgi:hypothetical protein
MNFSALQPATFSVTSTLIRANSAYQPQPDRRKLPNVNLETSLEIGVTAMGTPAFRCALMIRTPVVPAGNEGEGSLLPADDPAMPEIPYVIEIGVSGAFSFAPEVEIDAQAMSRMVAFNGISMLYGFARDALLQYTAMGSNGPFMLPALDISDHASRLIEHISDFPITVPQEITVETGEDK